MSKHRVAVLKVVSAQLSVTAAAAEFGISRGHLHRLLRRYRMDGIDALEPRSRRPLTNPARTPDAVRSRILGLRAELVAAGLDAGPVTIAWHLGRERLAVPSSSTIRRILHAAGLVVPEPRKRPRSSWIRFEAAAPNEVWQSDFTHWRLADATEVEILNWLDDHSRYLLGCTAFRRVGGDDVVATFTAAGDSHGWPAATLTDNGAVYTSRFTGGRNGFEYLLAWLGIRQKNGAPGHPQTQGKIERFHQTLGALARAAAGGGRPRRTAGPARRLPARLQRAPAAPLDLPTDPRRGLPGDTQGAALGSRGPGRLPAPVRHHRQEGCDQLAPGRTDAPPADRRGPRRAPGPRYRRRA
jgi:transposase InsO family protein